MRLRKVCPQCNTVIHVKRSCCGCGHVFTLKRKVQVSADKSMGKAVKRRRALETVEDTLRRQAQNRTRMASMRASETHEQTLRRQEQDRICTLFRAAKSPAFAGDLPFFVFLCAYLSSSRLDTSISRICMAYLQRFSLQLS